MSLAEVSFDPHSLLPMRLLGVMVRVGVGGLNFDCKAREWGETTSAEGRREGLRRPTGGVVSIRGGTGGVRAAGLAVVTS